MSDDNVTQLPPPIRNVSRSVLMEHGHDWLVGPFPSEFKVVIEGKMVPHLTGYAYSDGVIGLTLDNRMGYEFPSADDAYTAARAIADAMAIGAGFPSFVAADKWPYGSSMTQLDKIPR